MEGELPESFTDLFIPDHVQQLVPKQFTLITHDIFADILVILLGLAKYVSNTYWQQRTIKYCKKNGRDVWCLSDDCDTWYGEKEGHTHTDSMTFIEKCYDLDIDALTRNCSKDQFPVPDPSQTPPEPESESEYESVDFDFDSNSYNSDE